jgi:hypothetical protein
MQQEKISRAERSWTNLMNELQEVIHYSFIKFCIYCFSLWEFSVHYALRAEKNYQHGLDAGLLELQFVWPRERLTNPFRTLLLCFRVISKTPGLISHNKSVKFLSASPIMITSWQVVTRSTLCSGVKECVKKHAHNCLFPKSSLTIQRTTVLGMFKDSATILDVIGWSFLTISATAAMFNPVHVDFGWPPLSSSFTSSLQS